MGLVTRKLDYSKLPLILAAALCGSEVLAQSRALEERSNSALVYHGKLVLPNGKVVESPLVATVKIYSPEPSKCLLWSETQSFTPIKGAFAMELGYDSNRITSGPGSAGQGASDFREVFLNNPGLNVSGLTCESGSSYVPSSGDDRLMTVVFLDGSTQVTVENIAIKAVPFAQQASEIGGYGVDHLFKISGAGAPSVVFSPEEVGNLKSFSSGVLAGGGSGALISGDSNGAVTVGSNSTQPVTIETNNQARITVLPAGNVGVGTTSPTQEFEVVGTIKADEICIGADCRTSWPSGGGGGGGAVESVLVGGLPLSVGGSSASPSISIAQASDSAAGYLSSADWSLFNSKQPAGSYLTAVPANAVGAGEVNDGSLAPADLNFATNMAVNTGIVVRDGTQFHSMVCGNNQVLIWTVANGWYCNGVVLSEADPQVGANVANALSKWDGSALVASGVVESGGNLGIGTTSPSAKIEVKASSSTGDVLTIRPLTGQSGYSLRTVDGNGATMFTVSENGTVGIAGTAASGQNALNIQGGTVPSILALGGNGLFCYSPLGGNCDSSSQAGDAVLRNYTNNLLLVPKNDLVIRTGFVASTERMRVTSSGNVGIGTTTPGEKLEVVGNIKGTQLCIGSDCRASWPSGGGGSVSDVSSANGDISVANGTSTPSLTLNSGTAGGAGDANKIAKLSGTGLLAVNMIPSLDAAKVTSGSFDAARIPNLDAAKITSGQLTVAQGGTGAASFTANRLLIGNGTSAIAAASAITASRALISDANGVPTHSTVTSAELAHVSGVTSSIQTQLAGKQATGNYITALTGDVAATGPGSVGATIQSGVVDSNKITNDSIMNIDINASAAIADTKLATISTAGKVSNSATTATSANTASAIVARDGSGNFTAGTITATAYLHSSDRRLKKDIETAPGLELIKKLRGVFYRWINNDVQDSGVIAQEVEEVMPFAVVTDKDGQKAVNYDAFVGPFIEAIKEQQEIIESQQDEIRALRDEMREFREEFERMRRQ